MTWAQQWAKPINYGRPVVFACGPDIAVQGVDHNASDVETLALFSALGGGALLGSLDADGMGCQNFQDAIGTDDGALAVAYSISSTADSPYVIFDVHLVKVTAIPLSVTVVGDPIGTYETWNGTSGFVDDLWTGTDGITGIDGLQTARWMFYVDGAGAKHVALVGLHLASPSDEQYVCLLDFPVADDGVVGAAVLTTSPNPPDDDTINSENIVTGYDKPIGIRPTGGGLAIVCQSGKVYSVASGTITSTSTSQQPIDPPSGDTPTAHVASVSNVGVGRAYTFEGIS